MTQELTVSSILSLFDTTKEERQSFVNRVIDGLEAGETNPLTVHYQVKCLEELLEQLTKDHQYKKFVLEEAEKQGQKTFEFHNSKFEIKEVGVKYDYSKCGDVKQNVLAVNADMANKELKKRQEFLRKIPTNGVDILFNDEIIKVYPPSKSSTTSIAVTLK